MAILNSILKKRNLFKEYKDNRGMSVYHDWIDWLGGFPFEVASVDVIVDFYLKRGFYLIKVKTKLGLGNNHFVLKKVN
jgi:2-polyprenyl-6-hydroxyphenyl methylase/3-demethylubiquinone-9 3-methyltransferase